MSILIVIVATFLSSLRVDIPAQAQLFMIIPPFQAMTDHLSVLPHLLKAYQAWYLVDLHNAFACSLVALNVPIAAQTQLLVPIVIFTAAAYLHLFFIACAKWLPGMAFCGAPLSFCMFTFNTEASNLCAGAVFGSFLCV